MPWGAVAGAVIGGGASYLSAKEQSKKSRSEEPQWLQDASQRTVDRAEQIADRPYQGWEGPSIAGATRNEQMASQLAATGNIRANEYFDKAGSQLDSMEDFSGESLQKYMNPYTEAVVQPQIREANRAYERNKSSLLNSKAGAWGGDRAAFEESELQRNHGELVSDITGRGYADAWQAGTAAFFQDSDRKQRAAQSYAALGGDISNMNRQQIQDLMATGGLERVLKQAKIDFDMAQFREARDWDITNLDPLIKAISAAKGVSTTTTTTGPGGGAWGQALGAAATIAGAYFSRNQGIDSGWGSGANANSALAQAGFGGAGYSTPTYAPPAG